MDKEIKMLRFYMPQGWDDSECMLEVNGKRGKISMKYIYYITFTLQHILLYSLAMVLTLT